MTKAPKKKNILALRPSKIFQKSLLESNPKQKKITHSDIFKHMKIKKKAIAKGQNRLLKPPEPAQARKMVTYIKKEPQAEQKPSEESEDDDEPCDDDPCDDGGDILPEKQQDTTTSNKTKKPPKKRGTLTGISNPTKRKKDLNKPSSSQHPKVCSGVATLSGAIDEGEGFDFNKGCSSGVRMCQTLDNRLSGLSAQITSPEEQNGDCGHQCQQMKDTVAELCRDVKILKTYYEKLQMQYWLEFQKLCGGYIARCTNVSFPQIGSSQTGYNSHAHGTPCELGVIIPKPAGSLVESFVMASRPGTKRNNPFQKGGSSKVAGKMQHDPPVAISNAVKRFQQDLLAFP